MVYAFGEFELDPRVYELRQAGNPCPVEPQVFDVLIYLVRNRDRVVSKEELLDTLWPDRIVSETTLTSRLKEARKVLGDSGKRQEIIRTHHGRGYRFVASVEERGDMATSSLVGCVSGDHLVPASSDTRAVLDSHLYKADAPKTGGVRADFVGRRMELDRLDAALRRAASGSRQIVFVTGEGGAGKTTLVETFLARIGSGLLIARGQCVEHRGSGEAYMPLLDAFDRICREPGGARVIDILRRDAPSWMAQMLSLIPDEEIPSILSRSSSSGERMLRELGQAMTQLASGVPMILLLEDLHWSDYATLDAIDLLAHRSEPARLLVIGTYRPTDVKATKHPVYALSQELRVRGLCELIPLPLLVPGELDDYLRIRFGEADFIPELGRILHARTAGHPLFAGNLVDSWVDRGLIEQIDGEWTLKTHIQILEIDVPDSLQHLIEKQVSELQPAQKRILETASVIGREFSIAALAATLPAADDDLEQECETLVQHGKFLRHAGTDRWGDGALTSRFAFGHDLFVDVIYDAIPPARCVRIHQQVGLAMERAWEGREREHASELALHFRQAGDRDRGPRYLGLAAEQALERNAYREAVVHLTAALELLESAAPSPTRRQMELEIRCRLAPALIATRGFADSSAENNYVRARELAESLSDHALLSQMLYGMANMFEYRGEYELAEKITKERLALDGTSSNIRTLESHELLTCSMLHQGRYHEAFEHGRLALSAYEAAASAESAEMTMLVQAYGWLSASVFFAGGMDEALKYGDKAQKLASECGDDLAKASSAIQAAFIRFYRREHEDCRRLAEAGGTVARERRFPFHVACSRILTGWARSIEGDFNESIREIRAGIRTCTSIGARMDLPLFLAILSEPLAASGNGTAALETVDEALESLSSGRSFFYEPELHRIRGQLQLGLLNDSAGAMTSFRRSLALAEGQGSPVFALRAATSIVRLGGSSEDVATLRSISEGLDEGRETSDYRAALAALNAAT